MTPNSSRRRHQPNHDIQAPAFFLAAASILLTACGTIRPDVVESKSPSWDGSKQNSGLISDAKGSMIVTPHWRDRYNALAKIYGGNFKPAVTANEGITPATEGNFYANHFARVHFFVMNAWDKSAMHQPAPPPTLLQKAGL